MKSVALRGDYQAGYMTDRIRQAVRQTDRYRAGRPGQTFRKDFTNSLYREIPTY